MKKFLATVEMRRYGHIEVEAEDEMYAADEYLVRYEEVIWDTEQDEEWISAVLELSLDAPKKS